MLPTNPLAPAPGKTRVIKLPDDGREAPGPLVRCTLDVTPFGWSSYSPEMASRAAAYLLRRFPPSFGQTQVLTVIQGHNYLHVEILVQNVTANLGHAIAMELHALAEMSLALCDCGCGVDLTMGSCIRDGLKKAIPLPEECKVAQTSLTRAILLMRARTGVSILECKEALIGVTAQLREQANLHAEALQAVRAHATMISAKLAAREVEIQDLSREIRQLRQESQRTPLAPKDMPEGSQTITSLPGEKSHTVLVAFMSQKGLGAHVRCTLEVTHNGLDLVQVYCPTHSISYRPVK